MTPDRAISPTLAFTTPPNAPRWKRWLLYSTVARIVWFFAMAALLFFALRFAGRALDVFEAGGPAPSPWIQLGFFTLPPLVAYFVLVRLIEHRRMVELAPSKWLPHGLLGAAAGAAQCALVVALVWLVGGIAFRGTAFDAPWLANLLVVGLVAGVAEETFSRGVLFRIFEEGRGTWLALALSSLVFGGLHLGNPGATALGAASVVAAGAVFGLVYHLWRSLPLCMGLHAGWNFTQGQVFGIKVSGNNAPGWLVTAPQGPEWLSGGAFGIEGSVVALLVEIAIAVVLIALARRRGTVVPFNRPASTVRSAAPATVAADTSPS